MDSAPHFSRLFSQPAIEIIVGKEPNIQTFHVPENALLLYGSWFKTCLADNNFDESGSRTIVLPTQTPTAFSIFLFWNFHGILPETTSSRAAADQTHLLTDYVETYLLAQYLMIDDLKDAVMDKLCRIAFLATLLAGQNRLSTHDAVRIWNHGEEELRRFMIEAVVMGHDSEDFSSFTEVRELNMALNKELARRRTFPTQKTKIEEWFHYGKKGEKGGSLFVNGLEA